jgi:hypothetical protein
MHKRNITMVMMAAAIFMTMDVQAQDFSAATIQSNYQVLVPARQNDFDKQIESILKLFSSLVGGGYVHTASLHNMGGIDVGLRSVFATIPDEFKDIVKRPNLPDPLEKANLVPLPFLHASLGLPANFEVTGRFFSFPLADEPGGNITLLGGAVKYGLLQGNLAMPSITILGGYHAIIVPEEYAFGTVSTMSLKGYISKGFTVVTLYGGGGVDRTSLTLEIPNIPKLDYDVSYASGTVGLTIDPFPLFRVNADFNFGEFKTFTAGVVLSFR